MMYSYNVLILIDVYSRYNYNAFFIFISVIWILQYNTVTSVKKV